MEYRRLGQTESAAEIHLRAADLTEIAYIMRAMVPFVGPRPETV